MKILNKIEVTFLSTVLLGLSIVSLVSEKMYSAIEVVNNRLSYTTNKIEMEE